MTNIDLVTFSNIYKYIDGTNRRHQFALRIISPHYPSIPGKARFRIDFFRTDCTLYSLVIDSSIHTLEIWHQRGLTWIYSRHITPVWRHLKVRQQQCLFFRISTPTVGCGPPPPSLHSPPFVLGGQLLIGTAAHSGVTFFRRQIWLRHTHLDGEYWAGGERLNAEEVGIFVSLLKASKVPLDGGHVRYCELKLNHSFTTKPFVTFSSSSKDRKLHIWNKMPSPKC